MKQTILALAAVTALSLSACSFGDPVVKRADVEQQISSSLQAKVGKKPDSITCPGDLKGKVGQKMDCTLTSGGQSLPVHVTVTTVEDKNVTFDIQVGQQ